MMKPCHMTGRRACPCPPRLVDARVRLEAEVRRSVLEFQEVSVGPGPKLGLEPHLGVHVHSAARVKHRVAPQVDLEGERTELLERS